MEPLTVTIARTEDISGLKKTKIYELINEGRLRTTKVGRRTLVYTSSIRELLGVEMKAAA